MIKAVLELNNVKFKDYSHLDLENEWKNVAPIRIWLKARRFDLDYPVFVTRDSNDNSLTFFQNKEEENSTIVLVHPNRLILNQLQTRLLNDGYTVLAFSRVKDANKKITEMCDNEIKIRNIVVPTNLNVSYNFTYENFLNQKFPKCKVLTIDNRNYRDSINLTRGIANA